jgi:hypothetical protein
MNAISLHGEHQLIHSSVMDMLGQSALIGTENRFQNSPDTPAALPAHGEDDDRGTTQAMFRAE